MQLNSAISRPSFEAVGTGGNASFQVRRFHEPRFSAPYHFHPEYELTLIKKGTGQRYVGTHVAAYRPGDLVLLGPNLPHCWKSDAEDTPSESLVVQFEHHFLGADFFDRPELASVCLLLQQSRQGLHYNVPPHLVQKIEMLWREGELFEKLMHLLQLLQALSAQPATPLHTGAPQAHRTPADANRIHTVMAFLVDRFQEPVSLAEAAAVAHFTPQAFCKWFKRLTRKTFGEAVTDYRVAYAARQLVQTDAPVSAIGLHSGFDDLSNFYRTFKRRHGRTPLQYRNLFLKKLPAQPSF